MEPLSTMHALLVDDFQTATFRTMLYWLSLLPLMLTYTKSGYHTPVMRAKKPHACVILKNLK
jgi:hypothetical protein